VLPLEQAFGVGCTKDMLGGEFGGLLLPPKLCLVPDVYRVEV